MHAHSVACSACSPVRARQVTAPPTVVLRPGAPSRVAVTYRPLLAGEAVAVLSVAAPGLGPLRFQLRLAAAAAPPLRPLSFSAAMGSSDTQVRPEAIQAT